MDIIVVMCIGILVGRFVKSKGGQRGNEKVQLMCTLLLIFSMGAMLGKKENFFKELSSLGITSFLFFLIPTALSVLFVYHLTKRFMVKRERKEELQEVE